MPLQILSLDWIHSALGAGDWTLVSLTIVYFHLILHSGGIALAEFTDVTALLLYTLVNLVSSEITMLVPLSTSIHTFHFHEVTPVQLTATHEYGHDSDVLLVRHVPPSSHSLYFCVGTTPLVLSEIFLIHVLA